jgi:lipopolysaccharide/colanic/teichoic acid biosynthesis glycosyltransferase
VLYRQTRVGQYGHEFKILKLRSMINAVDDNAGKVTVRGDPRITRVGRWLRAAKLDEIPQLYNVLRGDMALVGPRPEVPDYVASYTPGQKKILAFRPGITGPASMGYIHEEALLAGSNHPATFYQQQVLPHKLQLDLNYCETAGVSSDLRILAMTIMRLVFRSNNSRA